MFVDISLFTGELPKELGNLVNLTKFIAWGNGFTGTIVCPSIHALYVLLTFLFFAGELPKHLPLSLETLQLGPDHAFQDNSNKFEGGIPAEWGSLTNLKKLNVAKCGIGGELHVPAYMRCMCADISLVFQENCPRSSGTSST